MLKLYLDDLRPCPEGFTLARTVEEAIDIYTKSLTSAGYSKQRIISLDHDLGGLDGTYTKTGYDFCLWIVEKWFNSDSTKYTFGDFLYPDVVYMHTSNPVGRDNMIQLLERYQPPWTQIHRSPMPYDFFGGNEYNGG